MLGLVTIRMRVIVSASGPKVSCLVITETNLHLYLDSAGFQKKSKSRFVKKFDFEDCQITVDLDKKRIEYPESAGLVVHDRTTLNFHHNENFVVLDCVIRLMEVGYPANRIELEPRWQLGRHNSGGKADILVRDNRGMSYLIVECKTPGQEFDKEWRILQSVGGSQLFSYAQQERATQFLCLYTVELSNGETRPDMRAISIQDNEEYLTSLESPRSFRDASDAESLWKVWNETYQGDYTTGGVFESGIRPYEIGLPAHTLENLSQLKHRDIQRKYNQFATILRQHNVSGHENAFDKLVNLFLAKIVDEMNNPESLQFYWQGPAFDSPFRLQDRLQKLYRDGMNKFLDEEVTYIEDSEIANSFRLFQNDPDATRDSVLSYFRQMKYFTNNDLAFLDVHNETLFYKNNEVLIQVVRMLQGMRLRTSENNQFLGDLFEGFLDRGVKQSEGQYFTPMPIVRFILSSLPLADFVSEEGEPPRLVDFACGAGHFLTEYATQIREMGLSEEALVRHFSNTFGVEKEYRLSKVSKVSCFMYGQEETRIVHGDALVSRGEKNGVKDGSFSILVSNPPYSVKGFLETLSVEDRESFRDLWSVVDQKNIDSINSIEAFFIERSKQLLRPGGVAAIILPSSFFTKGGMINIRAREILLKDFELVALVELGSGTFGKTGTVTTTVFARRRLENPNLFDHYSNRVKSWFSGDWGKDSVFEDRELLYQYCSHVGIQFDDYCTLMSGAPSDGLLETSIFINYRTEFERTSIFKTLKKRVSFKKLDEADRNKLLMEHFLNYVVSIEKDKLLFFMLASTNSGPVTIVRSPERKADLKAFLGYDWSSARGREGIKYRTSQGSKVEDTLATVSEGLAAIESSLFDSENLDNPQKINVLIREAFRSNFDLENDLVSRHELVDLIDFEGIKFDKQIGLIPNFEPDDDSAALPPGATEDDELTVFRLSDVKCFEYPKGERVTKDMVMATGKVPVFSANVRNPFGYLDTSVLSDFTRPSILWGIDGDWMVNYIEAGTPFHPTDHCGVLRIKTDQIDPEYFAMALEQAGKRKGFSRSRRAAYERLKRLTLRLPNIDRQREIRKATSPFVH